MHQDYRIMNLATLGRSSIRVEFVCEARPSMKMVNLEIHMCSLCEGHRYNALIVVRHFEERGE